MTRLGILASLFCVVAVTACACSFVQAGAARGSQATQAFALAIILHPGDRILEHRYENDQIEWKLPAKRLEPFRRAGVIIKEERHVTSSTRARAVSVLGGVALLLGSVSLTSVDVPRHKIVTNDQSFTTALTRRNESSSIGFLSIEDAPMVQLPAQPVHLGQRWQTRLNVMTTLGSGSATFDHQAQSVDNGRLRISVRGWGEITGTEYHLPKLLPGTIEVSGAAWYDLSSGLIVQESYLIRDRIIKPMDGEESGFDERLTVDINARKL